MNIEDSCISCIDTDWSYQLAKRMEKEKTNPVLGYRTAGSAAETATGDMLYKEMKEIGLIDVTRDTFTLDGWEFEKAVLKFTDDDGLEHVFQMGGYQTNFETDGFQDYELVYLGKGTMRVRCFVCFYASEKVFVSSIHSARSYLCLCS